MSNAKKKMVKGHIGYKLKKTQHALRIHMDKAMREIDLTTPQYAVLAQLELQTGISNAELARRAFITAQTMHGIVSKLEERKLIQREKNEAHGRILSAKLTKNGLELVKKAHHLIFEVEKRMLSTINSDQKEQLQQLLEECLENLEKS